MSTTRQPAGIPVGGQFAVTTRPEPVVELEQGPLSYPRSSDRPDPGVWQHPPGVARFDALTAYDDGNGEYTIGDDLHITAPFGARSHWIDTARYPLTQLHRAGLTGHGVASGTGFRDDRWHLDLVTPSGRTLHIEVEGDGRYQGIYFTGPPTVGAASHDGTPPGQDDLDAAALRTVTDGALVDGWRTQVEAAVGPDKAWKSRAAFVMRPRTGDSPPTLTIRPQVGQVDTHVTFAPDGQIATIRESKGFTRDLGTPRELALANLGRRIGLAGGRRAGVPAQVEQMLTATGAVNDHPDVTWLKTNQARARAIPRT